MFRGGPVNGGGVPYKEIKIPTIGLSLEDGEKIVKWKQTLFMVDLIDRIDKIIFKDGDLGDYCS
jgi:hypothetical protein